MNLLVAKTTLESRPSKYLVELTAYEIVAMLGVALVLLFVL